MLTPTCRLCARLSSANPSTASPLARRVLLTSSRPSATRSLSSKRSTPSSTAPLPNSRGRIIRLGASAILFALVGTGALLLRPEPERLSPRHFTPLKIVSVTRLTSETSLFKLALPRELLDPNEPPSETAIKSLFVMQPDLQIQRAYTPLSSACFNADGPAEIDLVVKRYPDGEASRYIHRLGPGDELKVRGPVTTWEYGQEALDEIVFIVGGTGITPALQYIKSTLPSTHPTPSISIIYASPSPSRILLKPQLDALVAQHPTKLSVQYLVDNLEAGQKVSTGTSVGRLQGQSLQSWIGQGRRKRQESGAQGDKKRMVVVCGPEQMVNAVAGPRARDLSQGPVGGMLGRLGYGNDEVIKL